jgi:hypothetical protein
MWGAATQAANATFGPNKIEFLNAAVVGWGTSDYVAYYEDYGGELGIQTVLVFLNTDDIGRSVQSGLYAVDAASGSLQRQPPPELRGAELKRFVNAIPFYEFAIERSHLLQLVRSVIAMPGGGTGTMPAAISNQWENAIVIPRSMPDAASVKSSTRLAKALFKYLGRLVRERNHKVIVLTTGWHKFGRPNPNEPTVAFMRIADQFFKENGINFVDLSDEVYRRADGTLAKIIIERDYHPNESGARMISDAAWAVLSKALP